MARARAAVALEMKLKFLDLAGWFTIIFSPWTSGSSPHLDQLDDLASGWGCPGHLGIVEFAISVCGETFRQFLGLILEGKSGRIVSLIFPFLRLLLLSLAEECGSLLVSGRASSPFIPAFERIPVRLSLIPHDT